MAEAYILTKERGVASYAVLHQYVRKFYFRTTDVTGIVTTAEAPKWLLARRQPSR